MTLTAELAALARSATFSRPPGPAGNGGAPRPPVARDVRDVQKAQAAQAVKGAVTAERATSVPAAAEPRDNEPAVLADRRDGTVVRFGEVVAKAHASGTDEGALAVRLRIAADPLLAGILLAPLEPAAAPSSASAPAPAAAPSPVRRPRAQRLSDGRAATLWPHGVPVDPEDPDAAPWEEAGTLLARLHAVPPGALTRRLPGPVPPMHGPAKAVRALARMRAAAPVRSEWSEAPLDASHDAAAVAVERAWAGLPAWCRAEEPRPPRHDPARHDAAPPDALPYDALCHGDFHLGQLVRHPAPRGPWLLIDVDDLGIGDPAWDLARPAAWYATGLLPPPAWLRFLHAYQAESGTVGSDPWPRLDAAARTLTTQTAALAVARARTARRPLDEDEQACVDTCARIAEVTELRRDRER